VKIVRKNNANILRIANLKHKGESLEYAVKREIPERYRLDNLLFMGKVNCRTIYRLAEILNRFHIRTKNLKRSTTRPTKIYT